MSPREKPRQRRQIDDELKIRLAMERYSNPLVEVRELAKRHGRAEAVVSRAISDAFEQGLVEVRAVERRRQDRRHDLEDALTRRFPKLRSAVVIDPPKGGNDTLHKALGQALADLLLEGYLIADGERIVIGGGRSIHHMTDRLQTSGSKLKAEAVEIASVCGDCYPRAEDEETHDWLDADSNANRFVQAFPGSASSRGASSPLFVGDTNRRNHYFSRFWAGRRPSLAILGAGVLDEKHRLIHLCAPQFDEEFPGVDLTALRAEIRQLYEECAPLREVKGGWQYHPLAEVGMRLFYVEPLREPHEAGRVKRLLARIDSINSRLFVPKRWDVDAAILIAGGKSKAGAMRHLLGRLGEDPMPVRMVCTDSGCASVLLGLPFAAGA